MSLSGLRPWSTPREAVQQLLRGATFRSCAPVAVVVGTVLSGVNHGDVLVAGEADRSVGLKIAANLFIPYLTSSTGALLAVRRTRCAPGKHAQAAAGDGDPVARGCFANRQGGHESDGGLQRKRRRR